MKPRWRILLGCALSISLARAATFTELPQATGIADQYLVSNLRTDDGLPDNTVTHLAQTPDGFIWFGMEIDDDGRGIQNAARRRWVGRWS